ncbi:hypothetical protein ACFYXF_11640 [Streptomyces sp. NPDC002680]|uniref:hypothetical protein n=1 Tax=Streptomyces sp. NPDC002680 TaxID=3364659 RepID=UPI0036AA1772
MLKPFVFKLADARWPEGATLLHVYMAVSDRDRALLGLVTSANEALKDTPLTPVPLQLPTSRAGWAVGLTDG